MIRRSAKDLWEKCLLFLRDNVEADLFNTWFTPIQPQELILDTDQDGEIYTFSIQLPSQFYYDTIQEKFSNELMMSVAKNIDKRFKIVYNIPIAGNTESHEYNMPRPNAQGEVKPAYNPNNTYHQDQSRHPQILNPFVIPAVQKNTINPQLREDYTMENFVEGESNKLARSTAQAIIDDFQKNSFNPFFIFGNVGIGKTHLAHAIGWGIKERYPDKNILYVSAEKFTQQYVQAAQDRKIQDFIHFYQNIDLLIVDDIHVLANRQKTQDVFFHIFNHLQQLNKKMIFTSDKAPKDLMDIENRIITRLKWGLTVQIEKPDYDMRLKILKKKIKEQGVDMSEEVLEFVSGKIKDNIRELEGVINSLMAKSIHLKTDITVELAEKTLDYLVNEEVKEITIDFINKTVCSHFNLTLSELTAKSRKREIVQARQLAMFFAKKYTEQSLLMIGKSIGGKGHATVLHSCKAVENMIDTDKKFEDTVNKIERKLNI